MYLIIPTTYFVSVSGCENDKRYNALYERLSYKMSVGGVKDCITYN